MRAYLLLLAAFVLVFTTFTFNSAVVATPFYLAGANAHSNVQDSAPSLEETMKWLEARLASDAAFSETKTERVGSTTTTYSASDRVTLASWDGCTLKFSRLYQRSFYPSMVGSGITRIPTKVTIRLADVKYAVVSALKGVTGVEYFSIGLVSENKFLTDSDTGTQPSSVFTIPFKEKEMAERVAKAMNHAMSLCKDKKEPF
jgi:hypothetical protein